MSTTTTELADMLAKFETEFAAACDNWQTWPLGSQIRTGWGGSLQVVKRSYGFIAEGSEAEAAVIAGFGSAVSCLITEDGRNADIHTWHTGTTTGDSVYVERWDDTGRSFHGYVDPTSRRVVQTG